MRWLLIISCIILSSVSIFGQGGFIRFYDPSDGAPSKIYDILYDEDEQVLYALCDRRDTNFIGMRLLKIDTTGEVIEEALFRGESTFNFQINERNNITKTPDGEFMVYGDLSFSGFQQFMYWFDSNLDSVRYKIIDESLDVKNNTTAKSLLVSDGYLLAGDKQKINFLTDYSLIKSDLEGNILWEKSYGDGDGLSDKLSHMTALPNNEYLLGGGAVSPFSDLYSDWVRQYYIVHADSTGNIINNLTSLPAEREGVSSEMVFFLDNKNDPKLAFGSARAGVGQNALVSQLRYFITSLDGQITDSTTIGGMNNLYNYFSYNKQVEGGFMAAGQITYEFFGYLTPIICKMDYNGQPVWCSHPLRELYPGPQYASVISGFQIMPSGSMFVSGYLADLSGQNTLERPFVMKLDRNGCLEENCLIVSTDDPISNLPTIYPNPAQSAIVVSSPIQGYISVYDVQGRLLLRNKVISGDQSIDISNIPSGIIFYEIRSGGQVHRGKLVKL